MLFLTGFELSTYQYLRTVVITIGSPEADKLARKNCVIIRHSSRETDIYNCLQRNTLLECVLGWHIMAVIISLHNETDGTRHNNYFSSEDCTGRAMYVMHFHVHAACPWSMSMLHVQVSRTACPCIHVTFHNVWPCCMSMLRVHAACLCCMSMWHVHAACPCCMSKLYEPHSMCE